MLAIDSPLHSVNDSFLIQEVNATIGIDGATVYYLNVGLVDPDPD